MAGRTQDGIAQEKLVKGRRVAPEKRAEIIERLQRGETRHSVAKETGTPKSTVQDIATASAIAARPEAKLQTAPARDFNKQAQRELIDLAASRVHEMLSVVTTPGAIRDLCVSAAIVVDKRRLMDGEATQRTESNAAAELARRLDLIAERKRAG